MCFGEWFELFVVYDLDLYVLWIFKTFGCCLSNVCLGCFLLVGLRIVLMVFVCFVFGSFIFVYFWFFFGCFFLFVATRSQGYLEELNK